MDGKHRVVEWNSAAERLFGYSRAEARGQDIDQLIAGPGVLEEAVAFTQRTMGGTEVPPTETERYHKDGSPVNVIVAGAPILLDHELIGMVAVYTDISERQRKEQKLRALTMELEQRVAERTASLSEINDELVRVVEEHEHAHEELLRRNRELLSLQAAVAATASSLDLSFLLDTVTWEMIRLLGVERCAVLHWNPEADALSVLACHDGTNGDDAGSEKAYALAHHPTRRQVLKERCARQMTVSQPNIDPAELDYMRETGAKCLLMQPMVFQDRVVGLVELADSGSEHTFTDQEVSLTQLFANQAASAIENARLYERAQREIAERKRVEGQISASLKEKEVLLKEIHHRVKNNMQVVSSLLQLQSRNIQDPETLAIFRDSQNRIRSMALIHEKLYRSQDLARVDFGDYLKDLTGFLIRSYRAQLGPVNLRLDASDVLLPVDMAVPCGLIVNELVCNALKHAFRDGREGEIRVLLHSSPEQRVTLIVGDNGCGFPEGVDFRNTESLGMQLLNTLVEQLDGTVELHRGDGTEFEIVFPLS